jgi:hypothetical protein
VGGEQQGYEGCEEEGEQRQELHGSHDGALAAHAGCYILGLFHTGTRVAVVTCVYVVGDMVFGAMFQHVAYRPVVMMVGRHEGQ